MERHEDATPPVHGEHEHALLAACQAVQLHLLGRFVDVCRHHDLRFHLGGGTLLGAIRDAGFIPWDDDIDVTMPRADFERLFELAAADRGLFGADCDLVLGIEQVGRLRYLRSSAANGPLALDILAMDAVPQGRLVRSASTWAWWGLRTAESVTWGSPELGRRQAPAAWALRAGARAAGRRRVAAARRWVYDWGQRRSDGSLWNCLVGSRPMGKQRPADWYSGGRHCEFEGMLLPVPTGAEEILTMLYGPDFMVPKPSAPGHARRPLRATVGDQHWDLA